MIPLTALAGALDAALFFCLLCFRTSRSRLLMALHKNVIYNSARWLHGGEKNFVISEVG